MNWMAISIVIYIFLAIALFISKSQQSIALPILTLAIWAMIVPTGKMYNLIIRIDVCGLLIATLAIDFVTDLLWLLLLLTATASFVYIVSLFTKRDNIQRKLLILGHKSPYNS